MVRLSDHQPADAQHLLSKDYPQFDTTPFVAGPLLADGRVAMVTTAGLHLRDHATFHLRDTG